MKEIILTAICFLFIAENAKAQFNEDSLRTRVGRIVREYVDTNRAGMVVGVIRKEGNNFLDRRYSFGHIRKDTNSPAPDSLTLFHIGSVTKTFTATILSMLIQDNGPLALANQVEEHLPTDTVRAPFYVSAVNDTLEMTLLDLATHYSALPDDPIQPVNDSTTYQMMYHYLNNHRLTRPPGECYLYSNLGVSLLGVVLSHTLGESIDSLFIQKISRPLGMPDTKITLDEEQLQRRATGYGPNGDSVGYFKSSWPAFYAAGGLYTSLKDFMKYLEFNMGLSNVGMENVLDSAHKIRRVNNDTCRQPLSKGRIGLVWQMSILNPQTDSSFYYTWKDGGVPGFVSFICFANDEKKNLQSGVVMIANQSIPCDKLAIEILRYMNSDKTTSLISISSLVPEKFRIRQNFPNPFNPTTKIILEIPRSENVYLEIFDISGKRVSTLLNGDLNPGTYEVVWDATGISSGAYYAVLRAGEETHSKKLLLVR